MCSPCGWGRAVSPVAVWGCMEDVPPCPMPFTVWPCSAFSERSPCSGHPWKTSSGTACLWCIRETGRGNQAPNKEQRFNVLPVLPFPCICLGLPPWDPAKGTKPQCLWDPAPQLSPLDNPSAELHLAVSPTLVTLLRGPGSRWGRSLWSPGTRLERSVSSNQAVGTTGAHSLASPSHFIKGSHGIMRAEVEDGLSPLGPVARGAPVCRRGRGTSPWPASVPGPVL